MATGSYITEDELLYIKRNPWADNFFRPVIVVIMIMCISISLVNMVRLANPEWRGTYFLLGMLITSVEAIYSYRTLLRYRGRGYSELKYRLGEATLLILVLKILSYMDKPFSFIGAELQAMWRSPAAFVSTEFYVILLLAALAWAAATLTSADFEALYDPYADNRPTVDTIAERFFWGGGILVATSGAALWISRAGAASLVDWQRPTIGGIVFNVLIYFMLGLMLLIQVNLMTLKIRWELQKVTVASGLVKEWARYGIIFLGIISLFAFLLPTSYSLGFLDTAAAILKFIINIFIFIFQLLLALITLPLAWLLSLLSSTSGTPGGGAAPAPPPMLNITPTESPPWLDILRSLLFWLAAAAIVGYMLKSYLDDHPEILERLKGFRPFGVLLSFFIQLWRQLMGLGQAGLAMIPKRERKSTEQNKTGISTRQALDWLGLRRLAPRERIIYYYINILQRAEKKGAPRKRYQTPHEYEPDLGDTVPTVQPEVRLLTDTFVHARYSRARFKDEQVALVKSLWQRIRKALRQDNPVE